MQKIVNHLLDKHQLTQQAVFMSWLLVSLAAISHVVLPHGIFSVSRLDHLFLLFSTVIFCFIGRAIINLNLIFFHIILASAFGASLILNFNESSLQVAKELAPLLCGSYIFSWHIKERSYSSSTFIVFILVMAFGCFLALAQNLTWENLWLDQLDKFENKKLHPSFSEIHIGSGYSRLPDGLGATSLVLATIVSARVIFIKKFNFLLLSLLFLSYTGMFLASGRSVWIAYILSLIIITLLCTASAKLTIKLILMFLASYLTISYAVNHTSIFSCHSIVKRGAEDRFIPILKFKITNCVYNRQTQKYETILSSQKITYFDLNPLLQTESIASRLDHLKFFFNSSNTITLLGHGPGSYPKIARPYFEKKIDTQKIKKKNYNTIDPNNTVFKVIIEYGVWAVFLLFYVIGYLFYRAFSESQKRKEISYIALASFSVFFSFLIVAMTRSYPFHVLTWFSFSIAFGALMSNTKPEQQDSQNKS